MNILKIKEKLKDILPKIVFTSIIFLWRNTFIRINNFVYNFKKRNFKKELFKNIKINNTHYLLKLNPKNGFIDNEIYINGIYERQIYSIMYKNIKKGDICVDIGANIGMYTNFFPQIVGEEGKTIGFEPIKRIFEQNKESNIKNNYNNVILYNYACSDKKEEIIINISGENIGGSSIINSSNHESKELIKTVIADSILLKENKIDFIKIDTEGYELNVLNGLIKTIEKFKPKIIIEFSPHLFANISDGIKILEFLRNYYKRIYIIEYDENLDLNNIDDLSKYNNLINEHQVNLFLT